MSPERASVHSKLTIQSYVILDFETTGLFPKEPLNPLFAFPEPGDDKRRPDVLLAQYIRATNVRDAPQIVEVCAISAARSQLLDGIERMNGIIKLSDDHPSSHQHNVGTYVRIPHHVHTRQIKPILTETEWKEYEKRRCVMRTIKLSRSALEECNTFADEWTGLHLFLDKMPKPVCIIAHNGVRYDYRILFAEMQRHDLLKTKPIPDEVYFIDSYMMFMDLEKKHHEDLKLLTKMIDWSKVSSHHQLLQSEITPPSSSTVITLKPSTFTPNNSSSSDTTPNKPSPSAVTPNNLSPSSATPNNPSPSSATRNNPSPSSAIPNNPSSPTVNPNNSPVPNSPQSRPECTNPSVATTNNVPSESISSSNCTARRSIFDLSDDHPIQFMRNSQWSPAKRKRTRPNLLKRSRGDWVFDNYSSVRYFHESGVFKLEQMYKDLINKPLEAHYAQEDCEALLQVCMAYGQEFIDYVDSKAVPFPYNTIVSSNNNDNFSTTHQ